MAATTTFGWARLARWLSSPDGPPLTPPKRSTRQRWAKASADDADDRSTHALLQALKPFATAATGSLHGVSPKTVQRWFTLPSSPGAKRTTDEILLEYTGPAALHDALSGLLHALTVHFLGHDAANTLKLRTSAVAWFRCFRGKAGRPGARPPLYWRMPRGPVADALWDQWHN